jgi:hypothetical protein
MKKGLIFLAVMFLSVVLFANQLYDQGYQRGYNDALYGINYFVSPTMGQPTDWVKGYKDGFAKGLKDQMTQVKNKSAKLNTFKDNLNQIVDLYQAVTVTPDETKMKMMMEKSENVFEEMRLNLESEDDVAMLAKGELLDKYVKYMGEIEVNARDAFLQINKKLIDYLTYRLMVVKEKGSRAEMRYYEENLNKVKFLVGRGM